VQVFESGLHSERVAICTPLLETVDGLGFHIGIDDVHGVLAVDLQRARLAGEIRVNPDNRVFTRFDAGAPARERPHQLLLHVAVFHRRHRATHIEHPLQLLAGLGLHFGDLRLHHW